MRPEKDSEEARREAETFRRLAEEAAAKAAAQRERAAELRAANDALVRRVLRKVALARRRRRHRGD